MAQGKGNQGGSRKRDDQGQFTSGSGGNSGGRSSSGGNKGGGSRSEGARKGGQSHSREHMAEIGRKGGQK